MVFRCFLGGAVLFLGLPEPRTGDDPKDRLWDLECTDDPVTTAGAFGPGETEIFFGPRTGRFSALDDSTKQIGQTQNQGTAGSLTISSCSSGKIDVEGIGVGWRSIEIHVRGKEVSE